jgi:DNA-binding SARP family transcriptional activator
VEYEQAGGLGRQPRDPAAASEFGRLRGEGRALSGRTEAAHLGLLQGFELVLDGRPVHLPLSGQRVLAFLALQNRPVQRVYVAGSLWLDASEHKANASLRTTLWRLTQTVRELVKATPTHIALAEGVKVDVTEATAIAESLISGAKADRLCRSDVLCRAGEILPDWYDDWVLVEREHFRQLRLHALESLCEQLTAAGRFAEATEAGTAAVKAEPLRESAHRSLVRASLAEGNVVEALRQYDQFHDLLAKQLGLEPSQLMEDLIAGARSVTRP